MSRRPLASARRAGTTTRRRTFAMTYCVGIMTRDGLVMASDSRTNASYDQVNVCRKMHTFVDPGERVFVLLTSGSLSCSQSIMTLLGRDFDQGAGLANAGSMYDAARIVGDQVRRVSAIDRQALEQDRYSFNVHILLGGQIRGQAARPLPDLSPGQSPAPPRTRPFSRSARSSTAGRSSTEAFATTGPRSTRRPDTR